MRTNQQSVRRVSSLHNDVIPSTKWAERHFGICALQQRFRLSSRLQAIPVPDGVLRLPPRGRHGGDAL